MEQSISINKRAQVWGVDLMIASIIFSVGIVFFYFYTVNETAGTEEKMDFLLYEARAISEDLLSTGYPEKWSKTNIIELGIMSEGKINETKLQMFYDLVELDYENTRRKFNTAYDYYISFGDFVEVSIGNITGIGKPGTDVGNIESNNLAKIRRIGIYRDKIIKLEVYVWDS